MDCGLGWKRAHLSTFTRFSDFWDTIAKYFGLYLIDLLEYIKSHRVVVRQGKSLLLLALLYFYNLPYWFTLLRTIALICPKPLKMYVTQEIDIICPSPLCHTLSSCVLALLVLTPKLTNFEMYHLNGQLHLNVNRMVIKKNTLIKWNTIFETIFSWWVTSLFGLYPLPTMSHFFVF